MGLLSTSTSGVLSLQHLSMEVIVEDVYLKIKENKNTFQHEKMETVFEQNVGEVNTSTSHDSVSILSGYYRTNKLIDEDGLGKIVGPAPDNMEADAHLLIKMRQEGTTRSMVKHTPVVPQGKLTKIQNVETIPNVRNWVSINKNIRVEDESVLQHRPYFDDSILEDDLIYHDLGIHFGGKISGQREHGMTDEIFLNLVNVSQSMWLKNTSTSVLIRCFRKQPKKHFDQLNDLLFTVIERMFDDYLGASQKLQDKYIELTSENKEILKDKIGNIDGDDAQNVSSSKSLHSYRQLFCRRCYVYDCLAHPPNEDVHPGPSLTSRLGPEMKTSMPCGLECYTTSIGPHVNELTEKCTSEAWSNGEMSTARVLFTVFPGNYCVISQSLMTKSCKAVYNFFQDDALTDTEAQIPFCSSPSKANRKKSYVDWRSKFTKIQSKDKGDTEEPPYYPCNHPGKSCDTTQDECNCFRNQIPCEKFCLCSNDCTYRYPGCTCKSKCNGQLCPCFKLLRECDPDLCISCNAGKLQPLERTCRNTAIQNNEYAETLMGKSTIKRDADGTEIKEMWGLFSKDEIDKDTLISEYCGEMISLNEAEKRGIIYDRNKLSYIFTLNNAYEIDATRKGNKIRFANHSSNPNCYPKILKVNGDHRIGIFAKRNIKAGDELFFDYGTNFSHRQKLL